MQPSAKEHRDRNLEGKAGQNVDGERAKRRLNQFKFFKKGQGSFSFKKVNPPDLAQG